MSEVGASGYAELVAALRRHLARSRGRWVRGGAGASDALVAASHDQAGDDAQVAAAAAEALGAPASMATPRRTLEQVRAELGDCRRCGLCEKRNSIVFGVGAANAPLMFVGEGPGAEEDRTGEPFVGRAGELLDKMIAAMGWRREAVYIANVVKCRPPENRTPTPEEVAACWPFLVAQIQAVAPRLIVALGRPAANALLGNDAPISALRGTWSQFRGIPVMPTYHPAFLLRSPERKRDAWADLQAVMRQASALGIAPT